MKFGRNYKHCSGRWVCLLIEKKKAKNREKNFGVAGAGFSGGLEVAAALVDLSPIQPVHRLMSSVFSR
jgi:NADH dehydrogenase FAD-containing subunit